MPLLRSPLSKIIFNSFVTPEISSLANNPLCSERTFEEPSVSETNNYSYWLLVHSHWSRVCSSPLFSFPSRSFAQECKMVRGKQQWIVLYKKKALLGHSIPHMSEWKTSGIWQPTTCNSCLGWASLPASHFFLPKRSINYDKHDQVQKKEM